MSKFKAYLSKFEGGLRKYFFFEFDRNENIVNNNKKTWGILEKTLLLPCTNKSIWFQKQKKAKQQKQ